MRWEAKFARPLTGGPILVPTASHWARPLPTHGRGVEGERSTTTSARCSRPSASRWTRSSRADLDRGNYRIASDASPLNFRLLDLPERARQHLAASNSTFGQGGGLTAPRPRARRPGAAGDDERRPACAGRTPSSPARSTVIDPTYVPASARVVASASSARSVTTSSR